MNDIIKPVSAASTTRKLRNNGFPKITAHQGWLDDGTSRPAYYMDNEYAADRVEAKLNELGFETQRHRWFCNVQHRETGSSVVHVIGKKVQS